MLKLRNVNHHHHNIEQQMYTSNNNLKQKLQSLNITMITALKRGLTLKQSYLIPMIRNMILPAYYLSLFVVILFDETKITSIKNIFQKERIIILRGSCYSMRCGHTSLTQITRIENAAILISHIEL